MRGKDIWPLVHATISTLTITQPNKGAPAFRRLVGQPILSQKQPVHRQVNACGTSSYQIRVRSLGSVHHPPAMGLTATRIVFDMWIGAGEAIRTPDPNLGKVMLYP